ncbi:MAG: hypothetical protein U1D26_00425 [Patescibacteria group bacterium]|nr:hypothetical protein [bacterium]MDZ4226925.1 hypothetical protein [Patescibacteria group bacterium]
MEREETKAEQAQRVLAMRQEEARLSEAGWRSTGDLPYSIGRSVNRSPYTITTYFSGFLEAALEAAEAEEAGYTNENMKKVGRKTLISKDLTKRITKVVEEYFSQR